MDAEEPRARPEVLQAILQSENVSVECAARNEVITVQDVAELLRDSESLLDLHYQITFIQPPPPSKKFSVLAFAAIAAAILVAVGLGWWDRARVATKYDGELAAASRQMEAMKPASEAATQQMRASEQKWEVKSHELASAMEQLRAASRETAALNKVVQDSQAAGERLRMGGGEAPPRRLNVPYCSGKTRPVVVADRSAPGREDIFADRDAARFIKQVLVDQLAVPAASIELLSNKDLDPILRQFGVEGLQSRRATRTVLQQIMDGLKAASPNDFVMVNVICHGERDSLGRVLLQLEDGPLPVEELLAQLNLIPCALKFCIVDACFSAAVSREGIGDLTRTLAARRTQQGAGQPLYPAIFLSSASSDGRSYHSEKMQSGVFQWALREVFRDAVGFSPTQRGYLSPADIEQRLNVRVAQLLAGHGVKETAQICLWSDGMKWLPLFAAADAPPPFGKLTVIGSGLSEARIEIDDRAVPPGFSLHQPSGEQFAIEPYWAFRVSGSKAVDEEVVVLGLPLASHQYRLTVTTRDGRTRSSSFRLTNTGANQTVELGAQSAVATPPGKPTIRITKISQREGRICGLVSGVAEPERYAVLVLIKTSEWYPHPYVGDFARIAVDGSWELPHVVRGSESRICALLVRKEDAKVPILERQGYVVQLEQLGSITVVMEDLEYQSEYRRVAEQRTTGQSESPAPDSPPPSPPGKGVPPPPPPPDSG